MRRLRNLAIVGIGTLALAAALIWIFRAQLAPALGVNLDTGPGGRAELVVPAGYAATVFAEGLSNPRFMAVSPDGVLFVAERGADRIVALPRPTATDRPMRSSRWVRAARPALRSAPTAPCT